ncbi:MAG: ABC transporter ATP-binding protein [Oscillospiraceae bacterium]|jgi:ABC-type multidrug transport system ATPase subunit|nr:ABC transporter ATP-binding protein [Oscillospiraceae bacterium]
MLTLNHITKNYGKFTALEDISLDFSGGVYALLAPNGAGKTTLIKMLTTLIFPTSGEILWNGDEITKLDSKYRDIIGYLPQDFGYYKNHSPRDFLLYISALKCIERKKAIDKIDELIETVGLTDVRDKKMKKFSGGMLQRVGIAQAVLNDPKILVLDEPTAGLDPKERVRFRNMISKLSKDRIVILSTHIVSDIETIANRIIMFKEHKLYANAEPQEICNELDGKVFETADINKINVPFITLTERQEGNETITRFASEEDCSNIAKAVSPNLEDTFLYIYKD